MLVTSLRLVNRLPKLKEMVPEEVEFIVPETYTDEELATLAGDVETIICVRLAEEVVRAAPKLRFIQKSGAGVDTIPFDVINERDILISNTSGANPIPVAESAMALVLALAKKIVPRHLKMAKGEVDRSRSQQLAGKTMGVLGLGSIGTEVARRALAFGMKVAAVKRHPPTEADLALGLDFIGGPGDLGKVLEMSDFAVVVMPLTPETRGIIGEAELRRMKPSASLVNVARAAIVDEDAVWKALNEGWIAGAAIDVWWTPHWWDATWLGEGQEATPSKYPFHELENVVVTPHVAGSTDTSGPRSLEIIAENIHRISTGREPINQVDKRLQY